MNEELIKVTDASFAYDGVPVITGLDFSVCRGQSLVILGENGSGKSTLIKGLLGLIRPASGKVEYKGGLVKTQIGYLPQQTPVQKDFPASVYEVVLSGALSKIKMHPFFSKKEKEIANENMELLGITPIAKKCYRELSGGQQQRVLLARALCATSRLILLDEPVSGLDPLVTAELYKVIKHLNVAHGITVIMVSHDMEGALKCATHILHLRHKAEFFGTKEDYLNSEIGKKFLGGDLL